jgi:hypothetical protein
MTERVELKVTRELLEGIEEAAREVHEEIQALWKLELNEGDFDSYERLSEVSLQSARLEGMIKGLRDSITIES